MYHELARVELDRRLELYPRARASHYRLVKKCSRWLQPEFVSRHRISLALKAREERNHHEVQYNLFKTKALSFINYYFDFVDLLHSCINSNKSGGCLSHNLSHMN